MAGEPVVETVPDICIGIPAILHVHAWVVLDFLIVFIVPALFCREECSPFVGIVAEPGCNRLVILESRVVIAFPLQFLKRLVHQKPDVVYTLINMIIQGRIFHICQKIPRKPFHTHVYKFVKIFYRPDRICVYVRIYFLGLGN